MLKVFLASKMTGIYGRSPVMALANQQATNYSATDDVRITFAVWLFLPARVSCI